MLRRREKSAHCCQHLQTWVTTVTYHMEADGQEARAGTCWYALGGSSGSSGATEAECCGASMRAAIVPGNHR